MVHLDSDRATAHQCLRLPKSHTMECVSLSSTSALLDTFLNGELLASCKHERQPTVTETGKWGLEAQLLHGKAVWP